MCLIFLRRQFFKNYKYEKQLFIIIYKTFICVKIKLIKFNFSYLLVLHLEK